MYNQSKFEEIAGMVAQHRQISGLSRVELARLAGVGKTVVFDIEHAKKNVRLETLLKILTVLNIRLEFSSPLIQVEQGPIHEKS